MNKAGSQARSKGPAVALPGVEASPDLRCSFCDKTADQVGDLIVRSAISDQLGPNRYAASPTAAICDECVQLCAEILEEGKTRMRPPS